MESKRPFLIPPCCIGLDQEYLQSLNSGLGCLKQIAYGDVIYAVSVEVSDIEDVPFSDSA